MSPLFQLHIYSSFPIVLLIISLSLCATNNSPLSTCNALLTTRAGPDTKFWIRILEKGKGNCVELLCFWAWRKTQRNRQLNPWSQSAKCCALPISTSYPQLQQTSVRGRTDGIFPCQSPWEQQCLWHWASKDTQIKLIGPCSVLLMHSNGLSALCKCLDLEVSAKENFELQR